MSETTIGSPDEPPPRRDAVPRSSSLEVVSEREPRRFGFWTAYFLVVASMVGAGILTTSGYTLRDTGNPAALIALWIVGGVMAICGGLTIVELATRFPRVGGDYIFVREGFGRYAGIVAGWSTFLLGFATPTALIARLAVDYLLVPFGGKRAFGEVAEPYLSPALASLLVIVIAATHGLGHQQSRWMQGVTTVGKLVVLLLLALLGISSGHGDWSHFEAGSWPRADQWPVLATGLIYVGYAYTGWNAATYLAGEIREPRRLLPLATIAGCLSVLAIYLLLNVVYVYALDPVEMMQKGPEVERVAELATQALFGPQVTAGVVLLLGVGLVASVSAYLLAGPRVAVAMARDGVFPAIGGWLHPARGTPIPATFIQAAFAIVVLWSGSFKAILDYASVGLSAIAALVIVSIFPIRWRDRISLPASIPSNEEVAAYYRMPFYPLPPLLFLTLSAWTIISTLLQERSFLPSLLSLLTIVTCVVVARFVGGKGASHEPE